MMQSSRDENGGPPRLRLQHPHEGDDDHGEHEGLVALPRALIVAVLLGVLTATSGTFISINCDFFIDLRFGFCKGLPFVDRNRCCGGSEMFNHSNDHCLQPTLATEEFGNATIRHRVDWITWEALFA